MAKNQDPRLATDFELHLWASAKTGLLMGFGGGVGSSISAYFNPLHAGTTNWVLPLVCLGVIVISLPVYLVMARKIGVW